MTPFSWKHTLSMAGVLALSGCFTLEGLAGNAASRAFAPQYAQDPAQPQYAQGSAQPPPQPQPAYAPPPQPAPAPASGVASSPWASPQVAPMMLMMAFHPMGLPVGGSQLKPGEYVRWIVGDGHDREMPAFIERARLPDEGGNEVFRVKYGAVSGEAIVIEGVVSPDAQIIRLRAKYFGDTIARDLPLQSAQGVTAMRMQITPEQIGATDSGVESITVPGGTFSAHHYVFQNQGGAIEWWFSGGVPGGIVKISGRSEKEHTGNVGLIQVQSYGQNAVSEL